MIHEPVQTQNDNEGVSKMAGSRWTRLDRLMRTLHLYTGLFLVPWMLIYAASAFCLNHRPLFVDYFGVKPPTWKVVREVEFRPDDTFPKLPEQQAAAIVKYVEMEGAHHIQGNPDAHPMTILRLSGTGHYRILWRRHAGRIVVQQQQPFSYFRLINYLHFRGGYGQPYFALIAWAVVVDAVAASLVLWCISGIYIWYRQRRRRFWGNVSLVSGILVFVGLVALLCL